jgi:hypothetical protein
MRYNRLKKSIEDANRNIAVGSAGSSSSSSSAGNGVEGGSKITSSGQKRGQKRKIDECSGGALDYGDDDEYSDELRAKQVDKVKKEPKAEEESKSDAWLAIAENEKELKSGEPMEVSMELV